MLAAGSRCRSDRPGSAAASGSAAAAGAISGGRVIGTLLQHDPVDQPVLGGALHRLDRSASAASAGAGPARADRRRRSPAAIGPARMLAAATASWIARLMPTPPIGDMAWAASPIASRPGRCQSVSRSSSTVSSLTWSQLCSSPIAPARNRRGRGDVGAESRRCPAPRARPPCPWRRHRRIANNRRGRSARAAGRWRSRRCVRLSAVRCLRQPEPEHVDRRAQILERQRRALAQQRAAAVGGDDQPRPDRRAVADRRRRPGRRPQTQAGRLGVHPQREAGIGAGRRRRNRGTPIAASSR